MKNIFLYIEYGGQNKYISELKYSLATLFDHHALTPDEIWVYTEDISRYANLPVTPKSIAAELEAYSLGGVYAHRIKPCAVNKALAELPPDTNLVFVDTDTYFKSSLTRRLSTISQRHVLMNKFEKINPYENDVLEHLQLPSGKKYRYDTQKSVMFNSGFLGLNRAHIPCMKDAIAIIDGMIQAKFKAHTIEQCAVSEAFRIHGIAISEVDAELEHYWPSTDKKYMHHHLSKISDANIDSRGLWTERLQHSWWRARLHKYFFKG